MRGGFWAGWRRDHIRARIAELAETGTRVWPVFMVPDDYEKALLQAPFWSDVLAAPSSKVLGSEEEDYADPNIQQVTTLTCIKCTRVS